MQVQKHVRAHLAHRQRNWIAVPSKAQSPLKNLRITTEPLDDSAFFFPLLRETSPSPEQEKIAGFPNQTKKSTVASIAL
jgi:hypothetical protein